MTTELRRYPRLFIAGEWSEPHSGRLIESIDPSTEDVWAEVAEADEVDVDRAVKAARSALNGEWARLVATKRGELMLRLAALLRERVEALAELESRDNGKPIRDTKGEVLRAADWIQYYAGAADKIQGATIPYRPDAHAFTRLEPVGVVGAILPWNSPISLYSWKLGPALAAGNTVVLKPAEQTPVTAQALASLIEEAGFPAGVVNVVPGFGSVAGAALVSHPGVDKISFTGEHSTGQKIMAAAAATLKRVSLECGGKSPHIVFADANLDRALTVATHSAFRATGQSCSIGSRLFLQREIYEPFLNRLAERSRRIRIGRPLEPTTHIGPQTSSEQLAKTLRMIETANSSDARLVVGGGRPAGFPRGYYVEPTIFADVDNASDLAQHEVFGPVLAVIPFETEDEVVELANKVDYGLLAGVWTSDVSRAHRMVARLKAGTVSVNTFRPIHWTLPYGGFKMSGIGRENGLEALHEFLEVKTVVIDFSQGPAEDPFAN